MQTNYSEQPSLINLDYMKLMSDGDSVMMKMMLAMLLEELPIEIQKMKESLETGNWEEMRALCHKMKSTLSFVGNDLLTESNLLEQNI